MGRCTKLLVDYLFLTKPLLEQVDLHFHDRYSGLISSSMTSLRMLEWYSACFLSLMVYQLQDLLICKLSSNTLQ